MTDFALLGLPAQDLEHIMTHTDDLWGELRGQRLLLTGGTGFVGKWLLGSFLHANRTMNLDAGVLVLSRRVEAFKAEHPDVATAPEIEWRQGDVMDFELDVDRQIKYFIHAATDVAAEESPAKIFATCVGGTRQVLKQAQRFGATRMLLMSSGAVYGHTQSSLDRIKESWPGASDCLDTRCAYGEGKRASEMMCALAGAENAIEIPIARGFAFVGPHLSLDKHFAIGNFIQAALKGQTLYIKGDGTPRRSYMYAADLAVWLWSILFRGRSGRAYNVGGEESVSIAELAQQVVAALGASSAIEIAQQAKPGTPVENYVPDLKRITEELGLKACFDLETSIQRTAQWVTRNSP